MINRRLAIGFVATLLVGAGGGFAVKLFAKELVPATPGVVAPPSLDLARVRVVEVEGEVLALAEDGAWRYIRPGFALERPTGFRMGPEARVRVEYGGVRLEASHSARLLIGGPGGGSGLQVEEGLVVAGRAGAGVTTHLPRLDASVRGTAYGVWALEDLLYVAVLGDRVEIEHADERTARYGKARSFGG